MDERELCECPGCGEVFPAFAMSPEGLCAICAGQLTGEISLYMEMDMDAEPDEAEETVCCPICGEEVPVFSMSPSGLCPVCAGGRH